MNNRLHLVGIVASLLVFHVQGNSNELAGRTTERTYIVRHKELKIHIIQPLGPAWADLIYFPSLANNLDGAPIAFEHWSNNGVRITSIQFPEQDDVEDSLTFAQTITQVLQESKEDSLLPLFIGGWSRGALSAIRVLQKGGSGSMARPLAGVLSFAPPFKMQMHAKSPAAVHPEAQYETPKRTQLGPLSLRNVAKSEKLAKGAPVPTDVPLMVVVPGADQHVYSSETLKWIVDKKGQGAQITSVFCPEAYHAILQEETRYGSLQTRQLALEFMRQIASGERSRELEISDLRLGLISGPCELQK